MVKGILEGVREKFISNLGCKAYSPNQQNSHTNFREAQVWDSFACFQNTCSIRMYSKHIMNKSVLYSTRNGNGHVTEKE